MVHPAQLLEDLRFHGVAQALLALFGRERNGRLIELLVFVQQSLVGGLGDLVLFLCFTQVSNMKFDCGRRRNGARLDRHGCECAPAERLTFCLSRTARVVVDQRLLKMLLGKKE